MGSALDRLIAEHGGGGGAAQPDHPSALDALIAQHQSPSAGAQAVSGLGQAWNAVRHPIDTVEGILKSIPEAVSHATAPVIGTRVGEGFGAGPRDMAEIERQLGRPLPRVTKENTPNAVTPSENLKGMANTVANVGFLAAPALSLVPRVAVNAGLGALNDTDQPVRGAVAGTLLGEVLHAPHAVSELTDFSKGMTEAGAQGVHETIAEQGPLWREGRRPAASLPINQRPAVEPSPTAETVSAGGGEPDALDKLIATRQYLEPRGRLNEVGDVGRRPAETLPMDQRLPVEPSADASTQSFGGPGDIVRRPRETLPMGQRLPVEPPPDAQTVSYGGRILRRPGGIAPEVSEAPQLRRVLTGEPTGVPDHQSQDGGVTGGPSGSTSSGSIRPEPSEGNARLETQSFGGPTPGALEPVATASAERATVRPEMLRAVNKAVNASPEPTRPFTATFGPEDVSGPAERTDLSSAPRDVSAQELLNKTTLDTDPNGSKALAEELDRLKEQGLDKQTVSFETQRRAAQDFADNLNIDRLTLDPSKYGRMSGAEIVGLKNVLTQNLNMMGELSKQLSDESLSTGEAELLGDRLDKLRDQNDALLSKIVKESSEKGRDLGFLRQLSNGTLDPDAWVITAKRLAGDSILSDEKIATIRRLAQEAADACGGA